jgi:hypothetical protein
MSLGRAPEAVDYPAFAIIEHLLCAGSLRLRLENLEIDILSFIEDIIWQERQ